MQQHKKWRRIIMYCKNRLFASAQLPCLQIQLTDMVSSYAWEVHLMLDAYGREDIVVNTVVSWKSAHVRKSAHPLLLAQIPV